MTGIEDAQATFTEIADAIRAKTGKTASMKITDMASEIETIETDTRVTLTITAKNASGNLSGATVVVSFSGGTDMTATTNSSGVATFSVKPGYDYSVVVSKTAYVTSSSTTVHVDATGASKTITLGAKPVVTVNQTGGTGAVTVTGGTYTADGNKYTLDSPGTTYTFAVAQVSLHVKPANQTANLAADGTKTLTFTHVAYPTVTVSQTGASGTVACSPTAAAQSGSVYTLVPSTNYTFSVNSQTGYFTPDSQTVSYAAGTTNTITFAYQKKPVLTATVTGEGCGGLTVSATNGTDTQTGTTNSSGVATITLDGTGTYTVSVTNPPSGASASTATVTASAGGTPSCTLTLSYGYGFAAVQIAINTSGTEARCTYPQTVTVNGTRVSNSAYGLDPAYNAAGANAAGNSGKSAFDMGGWATHKILEGIKPVSKNGSTWTDLDKTGMASWGNSVDAFTEFPINWLAIKNDGSNITIIFSDKDERPDSDFQLYAFAKGCDSYSNDQIVSACASASLSAIKASDSNSYFANSFHIGCFIGALSSSTLVSRRAVTASDSIAYAKYWEYANGRGTDYDCMSFQQWTYLQCLFLLLYRSTNSQTMHSNGISSGSEDHSNAGITTTAFGMAGSVANKTTPNAFFWILNIWGNKYQYLGGLWNRSGSSSKSYYWLPRQANSRAFNNGWTAASTRATQANLGTDTGATTTDSGNYIKEVTGTNVSGFLAKNTSGGSSTTYWPDYGRVYYNSSVAYFPSVGGLYNVDDSCGFFFCNVDKFSTRSYSYCRARLS